ncbi:MAG: hemerythrin domain-containing protein [Candidatus Omnitrophica bacterium]|nr:hemerythrin domain-containing protein [Candidatus Omnitrophota bacterium]
MKKPAGFFDVEEKEILQEVENMHKTLVHLHYEGKVSRGKNLKAARQIITRLVADLGRHRRLQEEVIFPYLLTHIPKHESVIQFLRSDHSDIKKNKERLLLSLQKLLRKPDAVPEYEKIHGLGIYLICLIRHHVELEKNSIHQAINKELRPVEKREVEQRVRKWRQKFLDKPPNTPIILF